MTVLLVYYAWRSAYDNASANINYVIYRKKFILVMKLASAYDSYWYVEKS